MKYFLSLFLLFVVSTSAIWSQVDNNVEKKRDRRNANRLRDTATTKYDFKWDKELRKNAIRFNPISAFVLVGNLDYERRFAPWVSMNINTYVGTNTNYSDTAGRVYPTTFFVAGGGIDFRFYPFKRALRGLYFGPYMGYRYYKLTSLKEESFDPNTEKAITSLHHAESQMISVGGQIGYQWILGNWFALNLFCGGGYSFQHWQSYGSPRDYFSVRALGIKPYNIRAGISIGIAPK